MFKYIWLNITLGVMCVFLLGSCNLYPVHGEGESSSQQDSSASDDDANKDIVVSKDENTDKKEEKEDEDEDDDAVTFREVVCVKDCDFLSYKKDCDIGIDNDGDICMKHKFGGCRYKKVESTTQRKRNLKLCDLEEEDNPEVVLTITWYCPDWCRVHNEDKTKCVKSSDRNNNRCNYNTQQSPDKCVYEISSAADQTTYRKYCLGRTRTLE